MSLVVGNIYRVRWPSHYNSHQRVVGYLAEFVRMRKAYCQLHGERMEDQAEFVKIKANGKRSYIFASALSHIEVTEESAP